MKIMVLWIPCLSEFQICYKTYEILTFSISISQPVHQYTIRPESKLNWKWTKSGSGAPGPKSAPRDTKSTIFAYGFLSHQIYRNTCWNTFRMIALCNNVFINKVCNNVCNNVCSNVCNCEIYSPGIGVCNHVCNDVSHNACDDVCHEVCSNVCNNVCNNLCNIVCNNVCNN